VFGFETPNVIVFFLILYITVKVLGNIFQKPLLCPNCLTQSKPQTKIKGSILIELILWLCFIIPGLIYSIWRSGSRFKVCPSCKAPNMIPLDSPRAKQLLLNRQAS
jgi:hypothetical protein